MRPLQEPVGLGGHRPYLFERASVVIDEAGDVAQRICGRLADAKAL
jgi:hypothetical protein